MDDAAAQRVDDAVAANEAHNRAIIACLNADNAELRARMDAAELMVGILQAQAEELKQ